MTRHPTAEWLARQMSEAFPWASAPTYLVRDNDRAYGHAFSRRVMAMGIRDRPISPRSPWQNGHMERLIGTLRRECLDRMLIFGEAHLRQILTYTPAIIITRAHTYRGTRIRRWVERSNDTETLLLRPYCRGCIIATRGYDFRKGQVAHPVTVMQRCSEAERREGMTQWLAGDHHNPGKWLTEFKNQED